MGLATYPLGRSDLQITRVGFGAWAVGGGGWSFGWGPQDEADSLATMRHALELGVNWLATAAAYGLGHSEELVGRLLRGLPSSERPLVFTKCGLLWDEHDPMAPPRRVLTPDTVGPSGPILLQDDYLLVANIVGHMADGVERDVQERAVALWRRVDADLGARIAGGVGLAPRGALVEADTR